MAQLKSTSITGNLAVTGSEVVSGDITASKFIKNNGIADEILIADGTVQNLNSFAHNIIFKKNSTEPYYIYNIKDTDVISTNKLEINSSNANTYDYDRIYVGNNMNKELKYRTK
jgi:hypothetical protein